MRTLTAALVSLCLVAPGAAQHGHTAGHEGGGHTQPCCPEGWEARLDRSGMTMDGFSVAEVAGEVHVMTEGSAGIAYRPDDRVTGDYTVSATFEQEGVGRHAEAYGLFFGGSRLQQDDVSYAYFLVRQDGQYLIKRRSGAGTSDVVGWTSHEAVHGPEDDVVTNALAVRVAGGAVHFLVNGTEVHRMPASELPTDGLAGVRVNHRLMVHVKDFTIERWMR